MGMRSRIKKTSIFILVVVLTTLLASFLPSYAEDAAEGSAEESVVDIIDRNPEASYILYDTEKGQVLLNKDIHLPVNASMLSRMMTCLIALENHSLTDKITASYTSVSSDGNFWIKKGTTYTVDALVNTALIGNAENAAKLLSENTEIKSANLSENSFAAYMNEKAIKYGMNDTFFTSADGSSSEFQKTTAYDTVIFLKHALLNTTFKKIYCSPVAVSWGGIIMNNPNDIVMENTTFTLGGGTGKYNNTESTLAVTYYMNNNNKSPADRRNIIMAIYGLDSENIEPVQKQLLDKYHKDWVKVLYREKDDVVSILTLGTQNLSLVATNDVCFYAPADDTDYIENITFSYAEGYAPDVIQAPVYATTPICVVRYQLKDKTVFDVTLCAQNTILSERTTVNKMVGLISQYPEIFLTIFVLCLATMIFALRKIYWHFALKV